MPHYLTSNIASYYFILQCAILKVSVMILVSPHCSVVLRARPYLKRAARGSREWVLVKLASRVRASCPGMFWTGSQWSKEFIRDYSNWNRQKLARRNLKFQCGELVQRALPFPWCKNELLPCKNELSANRRRNCMVRGNQRQ